MFNHFIPLALAAALGAAAAQGDLKGPPDQVTIPDDNVFTTVSKLRPGQGNWVAQSDVVVDSDKGRVWIKADAKVLSKTNASLFGKTDKVIRVMGGDGGVGVVLPPGVWLWEPVDAKAITYPVVPCMSWTREGAAANPTAKGGAKTKGGDQ